MNMLGKTKNNHSRDQKICSPGKNDEYFLGKVLGF
jgi:hypothetical protein